MNSWRDYEPDVLVEVFKLFIQTGACSQDSLLEIIRTVRMAQHISTVIRQLSRLGLKASIKTKDSPEDPFPPHLLLYYNREELSQKVWAEPMRVIAKQYHVSDVALAKTCRKPIKMRRRCCASYAPK